MMTRPAVRVEAASARVATRSRVWPTPRMVRYSSLISSARMKSGHAAFSQTSSRRASQLVR